MTGPTPATLLGCSRCGRLWSIPAPVHRPRRGVLNDTPWRCPKCSKETGGRSESYRVP